MNRPPPFDPAPLQGGPDPIDEPRGLTVEGHGPHGPPPPFGHSPPPFGGPPPFGAHRTAPGQAPLRVVGGVGGPVARSEVIAFIRQCHKGQRNRLTNEVDPWTTLVVVHLGSGREMGQWDVRPDEDDLTLAHEIDERINSHGVPLARAQGTQTYQIDCYFGETRTPRANQIVEVDAPAGLHGAANALLQNRGQLAQTARGAMSPQENQTYRHNEALMSMSIGMAQWNMQNLMEQLTNALNEVQYYRGEIANLDDRERKLKDAENKHKIDLFNAQRSAARKDWMIAKLANYAPVFLAKLDAKVSGMMSMSTDDKEAKALGLIKTLLGKLSDGNGGPEKLAQVATMLGLSDGEMDQITDFGKILWLEEQRTALHREAEKVGRGGGFGDLGKDVMAIARRGMEPAPKKE